MIGNDCRVVLAQGFVLAVAVSGQMEQMRHRAAVEQLGNEFSNVVNV